MLPNCHHFTLLRQVNTKTELPHYHLQENMLKIFDKRKILDRATQPRNTEYPYYIDIKVPNSKKKSKQYLSFYCIVLYLNDK